MRHVIVKLSSFNTRYWLILLGQFHNFIANSCVEMDLIIELSRNKSELCMYIISMKFVWHHHIDSLDESLNRRRYILQIDLSISWFITVVIDRRISAFYSLSVEFIIAVLALLTYFAYVRRACMCARAITIARWRIISTIGVNINMVTYIFCVYVACGFTTTLLLRCLCCKVPRFVEREIKSPFAIRANSRRTRRINRARKSRL